jgi:hypothetical protein
MAPKSDQLANRSSREEHSTGSETVRPWRGNRYGRSGRIYETRGGPDNLRWFWSMTLNGPMARSDRAATRPSRLKKRWDAWMAWAKLEETG